MCVYVMSLVFKIVCIYSRRDPWVGNWTGVRLLVLAVSVKAQTNFYPCAMPPRADACRYI